MGENSGMASSSPQPAPLDSAAWPRRERSRLPHRGRLGRAVRVISLLDRRGMRRLQQRHLPRWVQIWLLFASRWGGAILWLCVASLVEWQGGPQRLLALGAGLAACGLGALLLLGMKPFTRRQRPHSYRRAWAPRRDPDRFSFPSGHSLAAFAIATPILLLCPTLEWLAIFCAASVALSRILMGVHFPSDVLAGAMLGMSLGYGAVTLLH
jgi:undecaprenyl-diphosphatase